MQKINVEIQSDLVEKLAKADPIPAISELLWNGLDADADKVSVYLEYDALDTLNKVIVRDNGIGFNPEEASTLFKNLGGSWKKSSKYSKRNKRDLHGKEGRGRFKAFALGRVALWRVVYRNDNELYEYDITIIRDNIRQAEISEPIVSNSKETGVTVEITELDRNFKSLQNDNAIQNISETFALYLKNYNSIQLIYNGSTIDPKSVIKQEHKFPLASIKDESNDEYPVELEVIEWKTPTKKTMYLCNENGFPYYPAKDKRFHTGKYEFSAYLKSSYIQKLYQENTLEVGTLKKELTEIIDEAQTVIREHFIDRAAEDARGVVETWKNEDIYPYDNEPSSSIENVERKVFDIVAVSINNNLPDFSSSPTKSKKLSLKLLKQAIEKSPDDVQLILSEVLNLPKKEQKELASLLKDTSLSAIISASKLITDRLKFITGLEEIVFDTELKKHLKERSQLHQIIKDNTWIFGEEFNLSVSDQSLTSVLLKHKKLIGDETIVDEPVKRLDGRNGIVDLMLSRELRTHRGDEIDHLVIELKAPKVTLSSGECNQIESYAFAVAEDERFRNLKARWNFWLISDDLDDVCKRKVRQKNRPEGVLYQSDNNENPQITVWIKTWSQIIQENKARLSFIKEKLEFEADKGKSLKMLQDMYSHLLNDTKVEPIIESKIAQN